MLGYAVFVTVIAVILTIWIGKTAEKTKAVSERYINSIKDGVLSRIKKEVK